MLKNKLYILSALVLVISFLLPDFAGAAQLNQAAVRLGRLAEGATAGNDVYVTFKLNTTPTSVAKIAITFPSGFTLTNGTPTPVTTNATNTPAAIATPGTLTSVVTSAGVGAGGTIVVSGLTSASLNNTSMYELTIPSGSVQNPATPGGYNLAVASQNAGGTTLDATPTPTYIYGASPNMDQITVTTSVAPNFSFQLSTNSDTLAQVDSSNIRTSSGVTMTVGTDSPLGYTAYVRSANAALTSATSPGTPINTGTFDGSPDTIAAGITKYGFVPTTGPACSTCTGSLTYDTEYSPGSGAPISLGTQAGAFNGSNFASFVSRSGYTNADQVSLKERVAVANTIGYANDYTDTLTIVAAGNY